MSRKAVYNRGNPRDNSWNQPEISYSCPELSRVLPKKYHASAARPEKDEMVQIDGSVLEGGGQILRNSAALSCLLAQPILITKIRACRPKPGLSAQHLAGLKLVAAACEGELVGAELKSTEVTVKPSHIRAGRYTADVKTAGSVCLLIQTVLPCLLYASEPSQLLLKGGTDADFAPPIDYFRYTFTHYAALFGIPGLSVEDVRRGFHPKGNGEVKLTVCPVERITPVEITERGSVTGIKVTVYSCGSQTTSLADRCLHAAQNIMERRFQESRVPVKSEHLRDEPSFGNGWGLCITAETANRCVLTCTGNGSQKGSPEKLASVTAEGLIKDIDEGGCVDSHLQDQIIILMGLADGVSRVRTGPLTMHTKTAIHILESMTHAEFSVTKDEDVNLGEQSYLIQCTGIGLRNSYLLSDS